jgi:hypothetical protein
MTQTFRGLDNRFGGGHAREYVIRFLSDEVGPLVSNGRFDDTTGSALLSATSETILLAGWMSYDAGLHGLAQRYMNQALRFALAANDRLMGAEILSGLSHQATYLHHAPTGVDLARAAGKTAKDNSHGALLAEAHVMEAHAHARAGDEKSCTQSLSAAEKELDRADRTGDPQWIGYFDEAYLAAKFGHCFKDLDKPEIAVSFARRSLDMNNSYTRGRIFNLTLLAISLAQAGEHEEAATIGLDALALMQGIKSARATQYIRDLVIELKTDTTSEAVRKFHDHASELLPQAS